MLLRAQVQSGGIYIIVRQLFPDRPTRYCQPEAATRSQFVIKNNHLVITTLIYRGGTQDLWSFLARSTLLKFLKDEQNWVLGSFLFTELKAAALRQLALENILQFLVIAHCTFQVRIKSDQDAKLPYLKADIYVKIQDGAAS